MVNDEHTSTCSSFSNAREQQELENFNEQALPSIEQELNLWSPPPATLGQEEPFGVLPSIEEWAKLIGSNVQPDPPRSESHEIQQEIRRLEQSVEKLRQQIKRARKEFRISKLKNRRKMRGIRYDIDRFEGRVQEISRWGSSVNDIVWPILDERLERPGISIEESQKIEEFFNMIDEENPMDLGDSDDSD